MSKGRPRKKGEREPSGRLSRAAETAPNPTVIEHRRRISGSAVVDGANPADVAWERRLLTTRECAIGNAFAALHRKAGFSMARITARADLEIEPYDYDKRAIREMSSFEIVQAFDKIFDAARTLTPEEEAANYVAYKALISGISSAERNLLVDFFALSVWPAWLRVLIREGDTKDVDAAIAERRALTEDEVSERAKRSRLRLRATQSRDSLKVAIGKLSRGAARAPQAPGAKPEPPSTYGGRWEESVSYYVDEEGALLYEVVRRRPSYQ